MADKEHLEGDVAARSQGKTAAEEQIAGLKEEGEELTASVEELTSQLEVMTEERDFARAKEEELFGEKLQMEEDIMDTNNGYVWVTERLREKEEEIFDMEEQVRKLQQGNDSMSERCTELQDELMALRVEHQALKVKLAEEERMHKAARDRFVRVLKDRSLEGGGVSADGDLRSDTASTSPSTQAQGAAKNLQESPLNAAPPATNVEDAYEDDFDDDGE